MSVVGLIVEYNPFHNGHLYHLLKSKEMTRSKYSVAVMSGNFLQRGEPALIDKWTRAKMAIDGGVDLVIELPFIYASNSAEFFSDGAVKLLDSLGVVDSICFGSELGEVKFLEDIAEVLIDEPNFYKEVLKESLNSGLSYPSARSLALSKYFKHKDHKDVGLIESILASPNNILAIEYIKSLRKIKSEIKPFTIKRKDSNYHDTDILGSISSATSIRNDYFKNKNLTKIKTVVPLSTYTYMEDFLKTHNNFNNLNWFKDIFLYLFRSLSDYELKKILGVEEGLENRILKSFSTSNDLEDILNNLKTKRYTYTRIKRILISSLMNLSKDDFSTLNKIGPTYIRVLGASQSGLELLSQIKNKSKLPIISKYSSHEKLKNHQLEKMISFDKKSTDIYFTGLSSFTPKANMNLDYFTSPYINYNKATFFK